MRLSGLWSRHGGRNIICPTMHLLATFVKFRWRSRHSNISLFPPPGVSCFSACVSISPFQIIPLIPTCLHWELVLHLSDLYRLIILVISFYSS